MKPEDIVVGLETAKKLKAAGWENGDATHYFYWMDIRDNYNEGEVCPQVESVYCNCPMIASAPTAEEILRELPTTQICYREDGVSIYVGIGGRQKTVKKTIIGETLANAAASMWLYLKENNLLES